MEKRIAKITSTSLGFEDHGIFTTWLHVDYGGSCQGIGGRAFAVPGLDGAPPVATGGAFGDYIIRVLRACGVREWDRLVGRTIYALFDDGDGASMHDQPIGIENLPTENGETFLFADVCGAPAKKRTR